MRPVLFAGAAALFVSGFLPGAAPAQNLLTNAEFDADLTGWSIGSQEFITIDWSASDVDGNPASGSLEMNTAVTGSAFQCVAVTGGETYRLEGAVTELPVSSGGDVAFSLQVDWNDGADCGGSPTGSLGELVAPASQNVWHELSGVFAAPQDALSARVKLASAWSFGTGRARFDALFVPEPAADLSAGVATLTLLALQRRSRRPWTRRRIGRGEG